MGNVIVGKWFIKHDGQRRVVKLGNVTGQVNNEFFLVQYSDTNAIPDPYEELVSVQEMKDWKFFATQREVLLLCR